MNALRTIARELLGLFVDDGGLAVSILVTVLVVGILVRLWPGNPGIMGGLLMVGCVAVLVDSVRRGGRPK